jgi:hypothetical protein
MLIPRSEIQQYLHTEDSTRRKSKAANQECPDFVATTVSRQSKFKDFDETGTAGVFNLGVFGVFCARHETVLRCTDMYKGERFAYFDYILNKMLDPDDTRDVYLYYDVACRYQPHLLVTIHLTSRRTQKSWETGPYFLALNFSYPNFMCMHTVVGVCVGCTRELFQDVE